MTINGNTNSPAITQAERDKLSNVPTDTQASLDSKLDLTGGTVTGEVTLSETVLNVNGDNAVPGQIVFYGTDGPVDQRTFAMQLIGNTIWSLIPRADDGTGSNTLTYTHNGTLNVPNISVSGQVITDRVGTDSNSSLTLFTNDTDAVTIDTTPDRDWETLMFGTFNVPLCV